MSNKDICIKELRKSVQNIDNAIGNKSKDVKDESTDKKPILVLNKDGEPMNLKESVNNIDNAIGKQHSKKDPQGD